MPSDEAERLRALERHGLLGLQDEPDFDNIVKLGAELFGVPICMVTAVGNEELWLKSRVGVDVPCVARSASFCAHTILGEDELVVLDLSKDARFRDNPFVARQGGLRFYAGASVTDPDGVRLGAFCVLDTEPRQIFSPSNRKVLRRLASLASERIGSNCATNPDRALGSFAEATGMALMIADVSGRVTYWNTAAERLFGFARPEMIGKPLDRIIPERFRASHSIGMARLRDGGKPVLAGKTVEVIALRKDGSEVPIELSLSAWKVPAGIAVGAQARDISERRAQEAKLRHLAVHDSLTGLLNRAGFRDKIGEQLRSVGHATVLALDLDGFKSVNDTLGHAVGDALLQAFTIRLAAAADKGAVLARLGGDEFAVLLPLGDGAIEAQAAAKRILETLTRSITVSGHSLHLGVSVGIASTSDDGSDVDEILVQADLALFRAKKDGGRNYQLFDADMSNELTARRVFKEELRQATSKAEWRLLFQPQVRIKNGKLTGVEALLRWQHPRWGLLGPAVFLPVLQTHLVAHDVGCWVIDEACRQLAAWRKQGLPVPQVSVNLFSAQLRANSLVETIEAALARHALQPCDLELEITENTVLRRESEQLQRLRKLRELGVNIALDDFGTGYASLSTLKHFPLTTLKIDRSFVHGISSNTHSTAIVSGIIAIAGMMDLNLVAEGVEDETQARHLLELGCDQAQGFHYSSPTLPETLMQIYSAPGTARHIA